MNLSSISTLPCGSWSKQTLDSYAITKWDGVWIYSWLHALQVEQPPQTMRLFTWGAANVFSNLHHSNFHLKTSLEGEIFQNHLHWSNFSLTEFSHRIIYLVVKLWKFWNIPLSSPLYAPPNYVSHLGVILQCQIQIPWMSRWQKDGGNHRIIA